MIRILIAEDSKVIALLLRVILENEPDMKVVGVAEDGAKAIQMSRDLRPDLVTMDIHMPQVDGVCGDAASWRKIRFQSWW
jgi:two-component system chemotaxis response regulator CheB